MSTYLLHGGAPGRKVGDLLLPPEETGARCCADLLAAAEGVSRRDRVYLTPEVRAARMFASAWPNGQVYLVEPLGELEHDPDCDTIGLSFQVPRARVLAVLPFSSSARKRARRALEAGMLLERWRGGAV